MYVYCVCVLPAKTPHFLCFLSIPKIGKTPGTAGFVNVVPLQRMITMFLIQWPVEDIAHQTHPNIMVGITFYPSNPVDDDMNCSINLLLNGNIAALFLHICRCRCRCRCRCICICIYIYMNMYMYMYTYVYIYIYILYLYLYLYLYPSLYLYLCIFRCFEYYPFILKDLKHLTSFAALPSSAFSLAPHGAACRGRRGRRGHRGRRGRTWRRTRFRPRLAVAHHLEFDRFNGWRKNALLGSLLGSSGSSGSFPVGF